MRGKNPIDNIAKCEVPSHDNGGSIRVMFVANQSLHQESFLCRVGYAL